jgi:hypothetical protein
VFFAANCSNTNNEAVAASSMAAPSSHEINDFDWDSFLNHTMPQQAEEHGLGSEPNSFGVGGDTTLWTDMFLGDTNIDWIGLGDTLFV